MNRRDAKKRKVKKEEKSLRFEDCLRLRKDLKT
jgi:hypothetical protein